MALKILVTGADGFIGSHLVESLVVKGFKVKAFVYYNSQNSWGWLDHVDKKIIDNLEVFPGDIRDYECVESAVKNVDIIFNLASLIGIPYSYKAPGSYIDTNIKGIINIMNASRKYKIRKIIHTSTSEVYGSAKFLPMNENHPLNAQSPYAASKIGSDQLALSYFCSFDTPISIIRPFNTYGPRQSLRAIIPTIICQMLDKNCNAIKLGNLEVTRDFNYITDTVSGFISTIKAKKILGEVINIGNGYQISINELIKTISEILGYKKKVIIQEARVRNKKTEVRKLCASNIKAKKILKWSPEYKSKKGLILGLKKTIDWYKKKENLQKFKSNLYNI